MRVRDALIETFHLDDVLLQLEASIGVALHPKHGAEVGSLMRRADVAMYLAKETRSEIEVYDPARDRHSTNRLGLLAALRHAIDSGALDLHYQPKVGPLSSGLVGMEALVRWDHPERGPIPPDEFIPLAETSGLMHRLTEYVVDRALAQVAEWRKQGLDVAMAVNVSARDLHGTRARARRCPRGWPSTASRPRTWCSSSPSARSWPSTAGSWTPSTRSRPSTSALSLDDFGTGYSSMFMLKRLPVTEIKVDRSFVSPACPRPTTTSRSSARSSTSPTPSACNAVAEGVETEDIWARLEALGCDSAQGWFVARPMAPGRRHRVAAWPTRPAWPTVRCACSPAAARSSLPAPDLGRDRLRPSPWTRGAGRGW